MWLLGAVLGVWCGAYLGSFAAVIGAFIGAVLFIAISTPAPNKTQHTPLNTNQRAFASTGAQDTVDALKVTLLVQPAVLGADDDNAPIMTSLAAHLAKDDEVVLPAAVVPLQDDDWWLVQQLLQSPSAFADEGDFADSRRGGIGGDDDLWR